MRQSTTCCESSPYDRAQLLRGFHPPRHERRTSAGLHYVTGAQQRVAAISLPAANPVRRFHHLAATWRWLPPDTTADAPVLLAARGLRAFADGFVSVLLPVYLLG